MRSRTCCWSAASSTALRSRCLDVRPLAVPNRVHQEIAKGTGLEEASEHIVHPAPEGRTRDLDLLEKAREDRTLAGIGRDQVPAVADLGLADPVDPAEPLLKPVGVPRQVVVDHEVGTLEVDPFAGGVVRDQDEHLLVMREGLDGLAPILSPDPAVDDGDGFGAPEPRADPLGEVVQGVAGLGEDEELSAVPFAVGHERVVENAVELGPLGVGARAPERRGLGLEHLEGRDLGLELRDRAGRRRLVEDGFLGRLGFLSGRVVELGLVLLGPSGKAWFGGDDGPPGHA